MPHLVEVQNKFRDSGVRVVGVTAATRPEAEQFARELSVNYSLLAAAETDVKAYGIDLIWGSEIYLVTPDGRIVAHGMKEIRRRLASEFPS